VIDQYLLPVIRPLLQPLARGLVRLGVDADSVTLTGFCCGLLAVPLLALGQFGVALGFILINRFFDGLDGAVAQIAGPTDRGAFIDIAFDFFFYAVIPLGFALFDPSRNGLPAALLLAAFVGTGSSFLAFAAVAAKRGLSAPAYPRKGIFYLGGLTEGAETMAAFVAMCLWSEYFPAMALAYATLCMITTVFRWRQGWVVFRASPSTSSSCRPPRRPAL
jgi:phosphatidylglycerophosphate synthase